VVALGGNGTLATMLQNAGIRVITLNEMHNGTSLKQAGRAVKELWRVVRAEKPNILHLNSSIAGLLGALTGRIARVPQILFTAHGWAFNEDRPLWQRVLIKFFHYLTVLLSHRTIAVSSAIVNQMNWPGVQSRMKIINPGRTIGPMYARDEARTKIVDFCPALSSSIADTWLVCIAELHPIKRHTILLTAMAELIKIRPQTRLIIIGEGKMREAIEEQIITLGLSSHVFLLGNIVEAARFLKAFDLFVLVSKSESYGYVIHEAGLAMVPVVATDVGGIPDIIKNKADGILIQPDSVMELVSAIKTTLSSPELTALRTEALYQKLSKRTVSVMTQETTYLYELNKR
jgi:glycosyltransferase involved in cell wall biosynthesis